MTIGRLSHLCFAAAGASTPPAPARSDGGSAKCGLRLKTQFQKPDRPTTIKKVLVIENDRAHLAMYDAWFATRKNEVDVKMIETHFLQQLEELIRSGEINNFDLIYMDYNLRETSTGATLTALLRKSGYKGYIVANSDLPTNADQIISAGADFKLPVKANPLAIFD